MKTQALEFLPKARSEALITKEVADELLVYDRTRDKAHCLNETAAEIWKLCDGQTSAPEIARMLDGGGQKVEGSQQRAEGSRQTAERGSSPTVKGDAVTGGRRQTARAEGFGIDERIVWLGLDQLRRVHLLEELGGNSGKGAWPQAVSGMSHMSRREAVRRIGLAATIALPIVISVTVPTAAEAAVSCGAQCHPCTTPVDCCNVCSNGSVPGCPASTPKCT